MSSTVVVLYSKLNKLTDSFGDCYLKLKNISDSGSRAKLGTGPVKFNSLTG